MLRLIPLALCSFLASCSCQDGPGADTQPGDSGDTAPTDSEAPADTDDTRDTQDSDPWVGLVDCDDIHALPRGAEHTFYETNPTFEEPVDDADWWSYGQPSEQGMNGALLEEAQARLEEQDYITSFIVMRHGVIVKEAYLHGKQALDSDAVHSSSKSILADVVGLAHEQGHLPDLDQPVAEIIPEYFDGVTDPRKLDITVRHLLTMTAGFRWVEDFTEYTIDDSDDWLQAIVDLPMVADPGVEFEYSTGQTHLASAVLTAATGMSTCAYAHQHLLEPIGITAEHWGRDPQGIFHGGCNLYLTPRELLRFGLLHMQDGTWEGERILPAAWMAETEQWHTDFGDGWGYGYWWWLTRIEDHDVAIAWGYGGQLVYLVRDLDLVMVITTNTRDYVPDYDGTPLLQAYVIPAVID
jgi:hypothetical protein